GGCAPDRPCGLRGHERGVRDVVPGGSADALRRQARSRDPRCPRLDPHDRVRRLATPRAASRAAPSETEDLAAARRRANVPARPFGVPLPPPLGGGGGGGAGPALPGPAPRGLGYPPASMIRPALSIAVAAAAAFAIAGCGGGHSDVPKDIAP